MSRPAGPLALWKGQGAEVLPGRFTLDASVMPLGSKRRHEDLTSGASDAELDESLQEEDSRITDAARARTVPSNCAACSRSPGQTTR